MTEKLARISIEKGDMSVIIGKLEAQVVDQTAQHSTINTQAAALTMELEMTKREGERDVFILQENLQTVTDAKDSL